MAKAIEEFQPRTRIKIIESDRERAVQIADQLKHAVVLHGSALDQKLLQQADIQDADLVVALTNNDQINILGSEMAKKLGCKQNMELLNEPSIQDFAKRLGIYAHINPRAVTISGILQHVRKGRIRSVYAVQRGSAEVIEAEALETSPLVGAPFRDLELPDGIRIGAIYRDGVVLQPDGDMKIKAKDRVVLFATGDAVRHVQQLFRVSIQYF